MNIDDVIKAYVALRDKLDATVKRQKEEVAPIREQMGKIENWLQNQLQTQGLQNFKGASGTAFLKEVSSATVEDWDATLAFIKEQGAWELLERRVSKTVVEDFVESTGNIPPGVNLKRETVVQVRRG
jgi:hypothetical protein